MTYFSITQNLTIIAGGVRDAVKGLVKSLENTNTHVELFGVDDSYLKNEIIDYNNIKLHVNKEVGPRRFGFIKNFSSDLEMTIKKCGDKNKIIELHGLWMYKSIIAKKMSKKYDIPLIVHPHGHLDVWALGNKAIIKKLAYFLYERSTLKTASAFRALSEQEVDAIKTFGIKQPIALIPNGIYLEEYPLNIYVDKHEKPLKEYALYMARITEQKGLETLLLAWSKSKIKNRLNLKIAGPDYNGYEKKMKRLVKELNLLESVEFIGIVSGNEKKEVLSNARLFILPSFSEGFSIALLEASASKLPIIMTKYCNFKQLQETGGAFETDSSVESMEYYLNQVYNLDDESLNELGSKNYRLIANNYTWDKIAVQYNELSDWLLGNTSKKPNFIVEG